MIDRKELPRMKFSKDFEFILLELKAENNYVAHEILGLIETGREYYNGLKISLVDISEKPYCFKVTIDDEHIDMKIGKFIRFYFPGQISDNEAGKFATQYNKIVEEEQEPVYFGDPIEIPEFKYNPKDPRSTFLSLVTKTYPHGHETEVLKFLPELKKDEIGNYYKIIPGDSKTMFTSHLDTADREQKITKLFSTVENDEEYIVTDEKTILGADDKAGVTVMLYMMAYGVPGLYYFFIGEERGGIGSNKLSAIFDKVDYLKDIERCISFDRRNYFSLITHQLGRRCCSDEFGKALCVQLNKSGLSIELDKTGIYTDSASFMDNIRECTNISVGYFHEHTGQEYQNMSYLESLCQASITVDWKSLPTFRKIGIDEQIIAKNKALIDKVKSSVFDLETKIIGDEGRVYIKVDMDEVDIDSVHSGLTTLLAILKSSKYSDDIIFADDHIKIELR